MNLFGHLSGSVCRAQFSPLNRVPFGKFNGAGGPRQRVNPKLFEAVRPCFSGFSEQAPSPWMGQKVHTKEWERGCAKVS